MKEYIDFNEFFLDVYTHCNFIFYMSIGDGYIKLPIVDRQVTTDVENKYKLEISFGTYGCLNISSESTVTRTTNVEFCDRQCAVLYTVGCPGMLEVYCFAR